MATIISTKTSGVGGLEVTGDASGVLQLASNNGTTAVTVDASQNVGIGTSSPAAKLHVRASSTGSTAYGIMLDAGAQQHSWYLSDNTTSAFTIGSSAGQFTWANSGGERMRIDSSGNVLIGTTTASGRLVNSVGSGQVGYYTNKSSGGGGLDHAQYYTDGTLYGKITQLGAFTTVSDYRLKNFIGTIDNALDTVLSLKPCSYSMSLDNTKQIGFIAHELQEYIPELVSGKKDAVNEDGSISPQSVDYPKLTALLTKAIQELKAIVDTQAERIAVLESKIV